MTTAVRHPGAVLGVARFYHDPRGSMRGLLASRPGEGRLFAYALAAGGVLLAGRLLALDADAPVEPTAQAAAQAFSLLIFLPLLYYGLAALGTALARVFGGQGGWRDGRAAFFWAALVSAPIMVMSGLAAPMLGDASRPLSAVVAQAGPVFFAWALAQCYAEAFGFARSGAVFAVIAVAALAVAGGLWWARP